MVKLTDVYGMGYFRKVNTYKRLFLICKKDNV